LDPFAEHRHLSKEDTTPQTPTGQLNAAETPPARISLQTTTPQQNNRDQNRHTFDDIYQRPAIPKTSTQQYPNRIQKPET
jgi:hypothetical protein